MDGNKKWGSQDVGKARRKETASVVDGFGCDSPIAIRGGKRFAVPTEKD